MFGCQRAGNSVVPSSELKKTMLQMPLKEINSPRPRFLVVFAVVCQRLNWIVSDSREFSPLVIPLVLLFRTALYSFGSNIPKFCCLALEVGGSYVILLSKDLFTMSSIVCKED